LEICKIRRGKDSKRIQRVFECFLLRLVNWMVSFRRLHMKGVRSTRKENLCLSGQWITTLGESSNSGLKWSSKLRLHWFVVEQV
jgi:hypothetical protein